MIQLNYLIHSGYRSSLKKSHIVVSNAEGVTNCEIGTEKK